MNNFTAPPRFQVGLFPRRLTPRLYDRVVEALRTRHYSRRTEDAHVRRAHVCVGATHDRFPLRFGRPGVTTSPNEFILVKFEVKSDSRETAVMEMNAFGASSGTDQKANVAFTFTKIRPGVYRVVPVGAWRRGSIAF